MQKLITKNRKRASLLFAMLLTLCCWSAVAQNTIFRGTVTDGNGEPLAGVTVKFKIGNANATNTDADGRFNIAAATGKPAVLVFSIVGFTTKEVSVSGSTPIKVVMQQSSTQMNEVVVIGYGSVQRKDLTGSVSSVSINDLQKAPVKSFDEALAGRVAGVQVNSFEGQPGSAVNIVIRGYNSITQNNYPLFVIDGFPFENPTNSAVNPLNTLDPNDIESIDVLKDASSTAIYGARGANGVIIVTTKRGKLGAPVIAYNGYYGWQENKKRQQLLSPYEFVKLQYEIDPITTNSLFLQNGARTLDSYKDVAGINWEDQVTRVAPMQNHNLSLSGGNDKTRYSISLSTVDQQGIIINSAFKRNQGRFTIDQEESDKLKVGLNATYAYVDNYGTPTSASSSTNTLTLLYNVWAYRPVALSGSDDLLNLPRDPTVDPTTDFRFNPVLSAQNELRRNTGTNLIANGYAEYAFTKELKLKLTGGISNGSREDDVFNGALSRVGSSGNYKVSGGETYTNSSVWQTANTLTYIKRFTKDHLINAVAGFTAESGKTNIFGGYAVLLPNESLGLSGLDEGTPNSITSITSNYTQTSFFGRLNYNYKGRYLFTATGREEGSSRFLNSHRWGFFPSGAFAWKFDEEKFARSMSFLSTGKLRTSYGVTGNNQIGNFAPYASLNLSSTSGYSFGNATVPGVYASSLGNSDLKWETTAQTDIGLDLGFFKDRLLFTFDAYRKITDNLLLNRDLAPSTGYSSAYQNIGKVQNQGLEFTLSGTPVKTKNFSWDASFNISFNRNKVLALADNQNYMTSSQYWGDDWVNIPGYVAKVGQPIAQFYGLIYDGTYKYDDFIKTGNTYTLKSNITANGEIRANVQPGDAKYRDLNGDLVIDEKDKVAIGHPYPVHVGGFSNNFTYRSFDLGVFMQWSYGNDIINANRLAMESGSIYNTNQFASYANRWTPNNPTSDIPAVKGQVLKAYSTRIIEDGSFLRLKTVSLGYTLPGKFAGKLKLKSFRAYITAQNLYTWTKYSGYDPEVSVRNSALTPGFDYSAYPRARTIVLGINTTF
ncbi:SusC/RagA family TonB-linked outer membrane protein [Mucilaginibacter paludis]|uniref:TonB-dependent receptor plug n=1 Tax=Mucilaginibacter paludis DSM 18603 TaxID=714943 RepID=H1Y6N5_9SPHI|nr:TonB-dependent receptor [Mucilaginibacter paludis]EHQ26827.1 TonB-dependent receptor plug [Mucilaginibacter paludis DSM 18603]